MFTTSADAHPLGPDGDPLFGGPSPPAGTVLLKHGYIAVCLVLAVVDRACPAPMAALRGGAAPAVSRPPPGRRRSPRRPCPGRRSADTRPARRPSPGARCLFAVQVECTGRSSGGSSSPPTAARPRPLTRSRPRSWEGQSPQVHPRTVPDVDGELAACSSWGGHGLHLPSTGAVRCTTGGCAPSGLGILQGGSLRPLPAERQAAGGRDAGHGCEHEADARHSGTTELHPGSARTRPSRPGAADHEQSSGCTPSPSGLGPCRWGRVSG
jgi:hypothetical protein